MAHRDRFIRSPQSDEYAPYYADYVARMEGEDMLGALESGLKADLALLEGIASARGEERYAPDKWSIAELLGHVVDIERTFSWRAMCLARGIVDEPLPGVDQDVMVPLAQSNERGLASLTREYEHLRRSNLELFSTFGDEQLARRGVASGMELTARAAIAILGGHAAHHFEVLRERYVGNS